jgi:hypothetical protein
VPFVAVVVAAQLAVVLGTLGCFVKGLLGPARLGESESTQRRRFLCYLLVFIAVMGVGAALVVPEWRMQTDEERDFILSALSGAGRISSGWTTTGPVAGSRRCRSGALHYKLGVFPCGRLNESNGPTGAKTSPLSRRQRQSKRNEVARLLQGGAR